MSQGSLTSHSFWNQELLNLCHSISMSTLKHLSTMKTPISITECLNQNWRKSEKCHRKILVSIFSINWQEGQNFTKTWFSTYHFKTCFASIEVYYHVGFWKFCEEDPVYPISKDMLSKHINLLLLGKPYLKRYALKTLIYYHFVNPFSRDISAM